MVFMNVLINFLMSFEKYLIDEVRLMMGHHCTEKAVFAHGVEVKRRNGIRAW